MAYLGTPPRSRVLSSADIGTGAVTLDDISFTDQPTSVNVSGAINKHTMRLSDQVVIDGDLTITDNLILSKISDDGNAITLTNDSSTRTITGTGSLEASTLTQTPNASLTGMTGTIGSGVTLGSAVTGSPAISLDNATAPAFSVQASTTNNLAIDTNVNIAFDSVIKNVGGGTYGSNTYTAPISGLYQINISLHFDGFPNNITQFIIKLVTSNRTYMHTYAKFINAEHSTNYTGTFEMNRLVDLDANDSCYVQTYQNGGSAAADLQNVNSYFSGFLVSKY